MAAILENEASLTKPLPKSPLSYEQFLDWADEDTYAEWVDGKVEWMSPASAEHQDLSVFLTRLLAEYAEAQDAGKVLTAPFQMKLANVRRGREPDLLFILKQNLPSLRRNFLDGPADLAVEIVSPESVLRDRDTKYREYEAGGVREYWIVDPAAKLAEFFVLDTEGKYQRAAPDATGKYESTVLPGFWITLQWFWQVPLPPIKQVLQEWEAA